MKRFLCHALAIAAPFLAALPAARASIIFVAPTETTAGSITITAPISFTLTTGVPGQFLFVLQDFVLTPDASPTPSGITPTLALTINGNAFPYNPGGGVSNMVDNYTETAASLRPRDSFIGIGQFSGGLAAGDVVTISVGTYALSPTALFNQQATQNFTGSMFIADFSTANRASNIVSAGIPEPSTWALALGGAGLLGLVARRRRSRC